MEAAGLGSRAYAFLIDWHLRVLIAVAWLVLALLLAGRTHAALIAVGPAVALYFLYHPVLEPLMQGQSPGKRWVHLRVVNADGSRASARTHLVRNLWRIVDGFPLFYAVGLVTLLARRDQRRFGDVATRTIVIVEPKARVVRANARLPDALAVLLGEWLERYDELDPSVRDGIAQGLLAKAPDPAVQARARETGAALRAAVRDLVA